jgi:hypothetical protein
MNARLNLAKTALPGGLQGPSGGLAGGVNLDALPLSPYTSAVPWMDVILNPAPHPKKGTEGGMEEDLVRCRGVAN